MDRKDRIFIITVIATYALLRLVSEFSGGAALALAAVIVGGGMYALERQK